MDLNTDFSKNRTYDGKKLGEAGTTLLGFITSVKSESSPGYYQVRIPAIHGYCDINEQNCEEDVVKKDALPWVPYTRQDGRPSILGNNVAQFSKGEWVVVKFEGPNYSTPIIVARSGEKNKTFASKEQFDQGAPYILAPMVEQINENLSASQGDNGCFKITTKADKITNNGDSAKSSSKCNESGSFSNSITTFIGDFLKIIQDTDGKIGSKFVNSVTGELFEITGYIQKYLAAITGVLRGGIAWIKAIITKYVRKGIDKLVKLIMTPIKGVTTVVNETIERVLNMLFCSFGDIESLIANMIEDLLNTLVDSAINSVFGCLDTLIDGILNEILGEVLSLIENIMSAIESIAGIVGGFGDLLGEAINAVLDFLGISCGGSGDCATDASNALVTTFNNPGEFGITAGLKKSLNGGLDAISGVSGSIGKETSKLNAEAAEYARGVDLGTANVPGVSSDNEALRKAFTTANNLVADSVSNVFDFCGNLANGNDGTTGSSTSPTNPDMNDDDTSNPQTDPTTPSTTTAVVVGAVDDRYDATYTMYPVNSSVNTGDTQSITIRRNNTHENGVIIFAVHLKSTDTARVVGITPGVTSGGDLRLESALADDQYATNPDGMTSPAFPTAGNVVKSEKIYFPAGVQEVTVNVATLNNQPPSNAYDVTYTASIYRAVDDLDLNVYPYQNLPSTSSALNSTTLRIRFQQPAAVNPTPTTSTNPPQVVFRNIQYTINNVSVDAGQPAQFQVVRSPITADETRIKGITSDGTAVSGTHYTGGEGILTFAPGQSTAIFSVPTTADPALLNQSLNFSVTFTDVLLPQGNSSNLGGTGTSGGTSIGAGLTRTATLNYTTTSTPSPICPAEILLTTPPNTCIVQQDTFPLRIGFIAKTSVPGYTLSYAWERTYDPDGTWTPVTNGTRTESVDERVTTFGPTNITVTVSGVPVTLDGWDTNVVTQTPSVTYTGADTNELEVTSPSYLINDEEYYRCTITATPDTESIYTPELTLTTDNIYIGITSNGVFSSTVNCSPAGTLQDGVSITYNNSAPNPETAIPLNAGQCTIVEPTQNVDDDVDVPTQEQEPEEVTPEEPISNPSGPFIIPTIDPPATIPSTPVVVGPDGGIVSIPIPANLPRYKYPPLIPITGLGFGAIAKADLDDEGRLRNILIKSKGIGYPPSSFDRCGIITSIEITNVGGYYESSPTVYVNDDPTIAFAAIDDDGRVAEIRITNPKNIVYDRIPKIFIQGGGGVGASALAVVTYVPCDEVANRYLNVVNKYNESKLGTVRVVDCP
jgi:hypothetical protein